MKITKLILVILLSVLLLAYVVLRIARPQERIKKVFRLNLEKVEKIEIFDSEQEVELIQEDGIWKVNTDLPWAADLQRINDLFEDVLKAEYFTTPVSEAKDAVELYELQDNKALHIRVSGKSRQVHVLFSNLGNVWDYFRYADDSQVYQIKSKVVQHFPPELTSWRSPVIIHYWEEDLKQIRVKHEKNSYTLTQDGASWTFKDAKNDFEVYTNNYALVKIISILQNLRSYIFVSGEEEQYQKAFENPKCTVWITDVKGEVRKLDFGEFEHHRYMLRIDDDMTVLHQVEFDTVYRFTRNPEIFKMKSWI
ncbi:MAG: DUF4340 domain-containing protein [Candidatus Cloacimonadaceae bacterium]|jgi:hypothetical protein|nr:DUF4340 domain-containing protein [Candidatus Cloacimonadota bacterium]MDY0127645.1 DUF4340 domain-containing protein [Candidatus Cloacimonadaceae bacterium]MCB5254384.1 DUF4340 domain-containing protein [Candidatus Cloacimonadota bacterium]MCK9178188.1 DUF4340 domain-containing protein [Candidatus Cloacimonadota bacterium]MCK9241988.1 DUF4340 domain-containing protein [Candidatus Cloacimonadota bacterium]